MASVNTSETGYVIVNSHFVSRSAAWLVSFDVPVLTWNAKLNENKNENFPARSRAVFGDWGVS